MSGDLDAILRSAECLERGRANDTFSIVDLDQIDKFFTKITDDTEIDDEDAAWSINGQLLLAQQGIDTERTERMIRLLEAQIKPKRSQAAVSVQTVVQQEERRIGLGAIEKFEKQRYEAISSGWGEMTKADVEMARSEAAEGNVPEMLFEARKLADGMFPKNDQNKRAREITLKARIFAEELADRTNGQSFASGRSLLEKSLNALSRCSQKIDEESMPSLYMDHLMECLSTILDVTDVRESGEEESLLVRGKMAAASIEGMQTLYRQMAFEEFEQEAIILQDANYGIDDSQEVENAYRKCLRVVTDAVGGGMSGKPWEKAWFMIRCGFDGYPLRRFIDEQDKLRLDDAKLFLDAIDNVEDARHGEGVLEILDTNPNDDEEAFYKLQAFAYVVEDDPKHYYAGQESDELVNEIFCRLAPLRFLAEEGRDRLNEDEQQRVAYYLDKLRDIQDDVTDSLDDQEIEDEMIAPFFHAICLNFQECAKSLIRSSQFPVEAVHVCLAMHRCGVWTSPVLSSLVAEFVGFLPASMANTAVDYLCFTNDEQKVVDYMKNLNIKTSSLDLDELESAKVQEASNPSKNVSSIAETSGYINPVNMLCEMVRKECDSVVTLRVLVLCGYFVDAAETCKRIYLVRSLLTTVEVLEAATIAARLIADESAQEVPGVWDAVRGMLIQAMSVCDQYSQDSRYVLMTGAESLPPTEKLGIVLRMWLHIVRMMIAFENGQTHDAMRLYHTLAIDNSNKQLYALPHSRDQVGECFRELSRTQDDRSVLMASTAISTVSIRFITVLLEDTERNRQEIEALVRFCDLVYMTDEASRKIMEIRDKMGGIF